MTDIVTALRNEAAIRSPDTVIHVALESAADEIERLRAALKKIVEHDQIGGYMPKDEHPRHEPGYNIETYDGECAKIARCALEQNVQSTPSSEQ